MCNLRRSRLRSSGRRIELPTSAGIKVFLVGKKLLLTYYIYIYICVYKSYIYFYMYTYTCICMRMCSMKRHPLIDRNDMVLCFRAACGDCKGSMRIALRCGGVPIRTSSLRVCLLRAGLALKSGKWHLLWIILSTRESSIFSAALVNFSPCFGSNLQRLGGYTLGTYLDFRGRSMRGRI